MKKLHRTPQRIVYFRVLRPLLDVVVLLIAFGILFEIRTQSIDQKTSHTQKPNIKKDLKSGTPVFLEERFATEADMWNSLEQWLLASKPSAGNCLLETRLMGGAHPFYILCFGKQQSTSRLTLPQDSTWFEKRLFVDMTGEPTKAKTERIEETAPLPAHRVTGWMNTPDGMKTFNPAQQKWLP